MPISLISTPFDHFQLRLTLAVNPNLILEPCHIQSTLYIQIFHFAFKSNLDLCAHVAHNAHVAPIAHIAHVAHAAHILHVTHAAHSNQYARQ